MIFFRTRTFHFLLVLFFLFSCTDKKSVQSDADIFVRIAKPENKEYKEELISFGTIVFSAKNDIVTLHDGLLLRYLIKEGQTVDRGQIIAQLRNIQLEVQKEQIEENISSLGSNLVLLETRLRDTMLSVESRLISIQRSKLSLDFKRLEYAEALKERESKKELLEIGGISESSFRMIELSVLSLEKDIQLMEKELQISMLGYRDEDISAAGLKISEDPEVRKEQIIWVNTASVRAEIAAMNSNLTSARKNLVSIRRMLDELTIRSPMTGVVGKLYYEAGENLKQNDKVATVIDISDVEAQVFLQEEDLIKIKIGTPVDLYISSIQARIKAHITDISPMSDPQTGNFMVKMLFRNTYDYLKPGMFVRADFTIGSSEQLKVLPESVQVSKQENEIVYFSIQKNMAVERTVSFKFQKDGFFWFDMDADIDEIIIDRPAPQIANGLRVSYAP